MTCNRSCNDANNSVYSSSICSICDMKLHDSFIQQLLVEGLLCVQTIQGPEDREINKISILNSSESSGRDRHTNIQCKRSAIIEYKQNAAAEFCNDLMQKGYISYTKSDCQSV